MVPGASPQSGFPACASLNRFAGPVSPTYARDHAGNLLQNL